MTFSELMGILNGEYKETAGTNARNQCVDLANAYIQFVLQLPIIEFANAKDFPAKAGDKYEYILNTPTGIPQEGDLVIWGGIYGHIAIFIEGNANRFTSFDENYPTGSPCHVQEHDYKNVLGWLRAKDVQLDLQTELDKAIADRNKNWNAFISLCDALQTPHNPEVAIAEIKKLIEVEDTLMDKEKKLTDATNKIGDLESELKKISEVNESLLLEDANLKDRVRRQEDVMKIQTIDIAGLADEVKQLKENVAQPPATGWRRFLINLLLKL